MILPLSKSLVKSRYDQFRELCVLRQIAKQDTAANNYCFLIFLAVEL
jgi:hypothetical protein